MRPYETLIVLSKTLGTEMEGLLERVRGVVTSRGGAIDANHDWGIRRLAYPIRNQDDGHYHLLEYQADGETVFELERTLRITDGVLRFVSVQQEHTGLPEPRSAESSSSSHGARHTPLYEMKSRPDRDREAANTDSSASASATTAAGDSAEFESKAPAASAAPSTEAPVASSEADAPSEPEAASPTAPPPAPEEGSSNE